MVLHSRSSSSMHGSGDVMADQSLSGSFERDEYQYPSNSFVNSMQLSNDSYDTLSKEATFSQETRSTYDDEASSVYSDELSRVSEPPKRKQQPEPATTVFVLQHHIAQPTVDQIEEDRVVATREELETDRDEPTENEAESKREPRSFTRFKKHFGRKKKSPEASGRVPPPKEELESKLKEESECKPSESKSSLRGRGFLRSRSRGSKSSVVQEEQTSAVPQLDVVSSTESDDDDRDESTDGGSLNTYGESTLDDSTADGFTVDDNRHSWSVGGKSRRRGSARDASTVAATAEASRSRDDLSVGMTVNDEKSVRSSRSNRSSKSSKSTKSNRSIKSNRSSKSNRSNRSIRSLTGVFKRKSRDEKYDDRSKSATTLSGEEATEDGRKIKKRRSWIPMLRRRSPQKKQSTKPMKKPRKGILRKRGSSVKNDEPQETPVVEEPSRWEALLDGCDGFCCRPLFDEDEISNDGDGSETPSEIYINTESSKTLVTV